MDAKVKFNQFLIKNGLRQTKQRDEIVNVFLKMERHLNTQELFDIVRKKDKNIGYATVARTFKLLEESGLCRVVDFGDGVQRFEHKYGHEHHDHLICTRCGLVVEISSPELERLQNTLVAAHGYVQERHKLEIFGICPKCQKGKKSKKKKAPARR